MNEPLHIAVDLGAGSGRVFIGGISQAELLLEEVHRFQYNPSNGDGHLRWDVAQIFREIKTGLREAGKWSRHLDRAVSTIGVDSWGTDYGLINSRGELCENPICYRDKRTQASVEKVLGLVSRE